MDVITCDTSTIASVAVSALPAITFISYTSASRLIIAHIIFFIAHGAGLAIFRVIYDTASCFLDWSVVGRGIAERL
jgi:hypothetical protein